MAGRVLLVLAVGAVLTAIGAGAGAAAAWQQPAVWHLVEEWRVGGEVQGPHAFDDVRDIDVLPGGRLLVLNGKDQQLHVLDARGAPVRTIGRRGAGPGEFRGAAGAAVAPDGSFIVADHELGRLTVFSPSGEFVRTAIALGFSGRSGWVAQVDAQGRLTEFGSVLRPLPDGELQPWPARRLWSSDLSRADTTVTAVCVEAPLLSQWDIVYRVRQDARSYWQAAYQWVFPAVYDAPAGGGAFWSGIGRAYTRIRRTTLDSCTPLATIEFGEGPRIPAAVRGRAQESMRNLARGQAGNPHRPDPDKVPATLPAFEALAPDSANRLWVERYTGERLQFSPGSRTSMQGTPSGPRRFEVFSTSGAPVATVAAPDSVSFRRPVAIGADRLYAFVPDDDGVLHLIAYRIAR